MGIMDYILRDAIKEALEIGVNMWEEHNINKRRTKIESEKYEKLKKTVAILRSHFFSPNHIAKFLSLSKKQVWEFFKVIEDDYNNSELKNPYEPIIIALYKL